MDFSGKHVLITGGSRGIGRAAAVAFAARGARVAVSYLSNTKAADQAIAEMPGGPHMRVRSNVGDPDAAKRLVDDVVDQLGGLDILVNNAGTHRIHSLDEVDYDEWQRAWRDTLEVNLFGAANVSYCAARYMIEHGGGRIVNVSSRGAFRGEPDHPAYGAKLLRGSLHHILWHLGNARRPAFTTPNYSASSDLHKSQVVQESAIR